MPDRFYSQVVRSSFEAIVLVYLYELLFTRVVWKKKIFIDAKVNILIKKRQ